MSRRRPLFVAAVVLTVTAVGIAALTYLFAPEPPPALPALPARGEPSPTDPHRPYPYGRVVVIAVGVNRYPNLTGEDASLRCAEADALAFADLTASHYGYETTRLIGPQASKREIELAVKRTAEELGPDDALIFFFAGHGQVIELAGAGEAGFLLPQDAALDMKVTGRHDAWRTQAVNVHELFARASASQARHVLFVLDACKSGIATGRGKVGDRADIKAFLFEKSRAVLAAVRRDQTAREDLAAGHGRFTAALLGRLRSADPATALDVYQQVSRDVAAASSGTMLPQFGQIEGDGMVVFIPKAIPREEVEKDLANVPVGPLAAAQARAAELLKQRTTEAEVLEAFRALDYRPSPDAEDRAKIWESKFQRFRRNAGLRDARAMAALSLCYAKGLGTKPDAGLAYDWAKQADRTPNPPGLGRWALGLCLENGTGVGPKNPAAAEKLFRDSAAADYPSGKLSLAQHYMRTGQTDRQPVRQLLAEAEKSGLPEAGVDLADLLVGEKLAARKSAGPLADAVRAEKKLADLSAVVADAKTRYEVAAAAGLARGEFGLFLIFADGRPGFPSRDVVKAEKHLRNAVAAGLPEALFHLGVAHEGDGSEYVLLELEKRPTLAQDYFGRAARLNYPPALVRSARMLATGEGGPADEQLARVRLEAALAADYPRAYVLKGGLHQRGLIFPKSEGKAVECFEKAASGGGARECVVLGQVYWTGIGDMAKRSLNGRRFHPHTHVAAHWLMRAIVLDTDKRDPLVQKTALPLLKRLRSNDEGWADEFDKFDESAFSTFEVLHQWKEAHPETFRQFCDRYGVRLGPKSTPSK